MTSIGDSAFQSCSSLTNFNVSTNNRYYSASDDGKILYNKDKTQIIAYPSATGNITIPDSVTSIDDGVFCGCESLTSVTIPNSVTSIGNEAFYGCLNLKSMTFTDLDCTWYSYKVNSNYVIIANIEQLSTPMNLKNPVANVDYFKYFKKHLWFKRK